MDFYNTRDTYILCKDNASLWCNRVNGNLQVRSASVIEDLQIRPKCLGTVYGVVGKIKFLPGSGDKLVLITKRHEVGKLADESPIYRIEKIAIIPLSSDECPEIDFDSCEEHCGPSSSKQVPQPRVAQTFNNLKTSLANQFNKATTNKNNFQKASDKDVTRDKEKMEKLERRLQEEFVKMFNDSQSFYYSEHCDLTNTVQRNVQKDKESKKLPIWTTADDRFFWNKAMLEEIIALTESDASANEWIVPIIQGYVQTALCEVDYSESGMNVHMLTQVAAEKFDLILISRRSVLRAGTRYKRRGVDEDGNVANYVETEQIVRAGTHYLSFVQLRGSIPLYWSQAGIKYRPPPKLEKNKEESQHAMKKHLAKELALYKNMAIINLVERSGREQVLYDALMEQIITYDNPLLTYVTFDFHEYCRGMKFENVSKLVETVADITDNMKFSWVDDQGVIWEQQGVFRVNCMDCLDRTNVVQAALARYVLETQLSRLGRLMPENSLPADIRDIYQDMWANNGDAISRQYAGTAAMKGDFTRTGERKFTGVMKDGYHSANRYLNRFTAAYRQTVIDIMLGIPPTEDISVLIAAMKQPEDTTEEWTLQREEWVAQLVEQCHQLLVHEGEHYLGGWALIEPLIGSDEEGSDFEQEVVLLLTEKAFYIASYNEEEQCVNQYECQSLENLEKIEIGQDISQRFPNSGLRLHYRSKEESGYFHTFKALQNRTADEDKDVLHGIADEFRKASLVINLKPKVIECRLNKKKSKPHDVIQLSYKSRPCSVKNHYRGKKASCSSKISSMVHSTSAPAKLDKMASQQKTPNSAEVSHEEGNINDCSTSKSDLYKRNLSAGAETLKQSDALEVKITQHNFEDELLSRRSDTNDDTKCSDCVNMTSSEQQVNLSEGANDGFPEENSVDSDLYMDIIAESSSKEENFEHQNLNQASEDSNRLDKETYREKVMTEKQGEVSSHVEASSNQSSEVPFDDSSEIETSKELDQSEESGKKSKLSSLIERGKKCSSANNSPKVTRKHGDSNKTSNELPKESGTGSNLASNLKNFKNRFAEISISFRKNDNSVNASEVRWQSEDFADTLELPRTDGKRNILAAAQERGRAFIPELKNKFTGLSNRSPRLDRRRDWEKIIQESRCRTTIIQI